MWGFFVFILGLVLGALLGAVTSLWVDVNYNDVLSRRRRAKLNERERLHMRHLVENSNGAVVLAGVRTRFRLVEGADGLYLDPLNVAIRFLPEYAELPPVLEDARTRLMNEIQNDPAISAGQMEHWSGKDLVSMDSYTLKRQGPLEEPVLKLTVRKCDYFTFRATNLSLDKKTPNGKTLRELLLQDEGEAVVNPIAPLANGIGISLVVVTSDNQCIMSRRRKGALARGDQLDVGVTEGLHWGLDRRGANLDVVAAALRGIEEELGVCAERSDVRLLGFGVDFEYYQWNFVGEASLDMTAADVLEAHSHVAKDNWEQGLIVVPCDNPRDFFRAVAAEGGDRMWSTAHVACYLAMALRYGSAQTRAAYKAELG